MQARAILFTNVGQVAVAVAEIPPPGLGEVLVEAAYTAISPGTELRCLAGAQPGAAPWPFIPGYALAGTVIERGADVTLPLGTRVYCGGTRESSHARMWGGHVSHAVLPAEAAFLVPDGVDLLDASLARLAAIAYHGARVANTRPGEQVAVVGLGPIGQLAARCHHALGGRVVATDRSEERVALARAAGLEAVVAPGRLAEALAPHLPNGADVVVDATGVPAVLPQAIALARTLPWDDEPTPGARYLVQGSYPAEFAIPYQEAFAKELTFILPRDTQPRDVRAVLDLMRDGRLAVRDLIGAVRPPEEAPATYAELQRQPGGLITAAFRWR
jgi:2-desacetyl-2-hydroxyethyl bacteriochlorophyllide A dehydrogenase